MAAADRKTLTAPARPFSYVEGRWEPRRGAAPVSLCAETRGEVGQQRDGVGIVRLLLDEIRGRPRRPPPTGRALSSRRRSPGGWTLLACSEVN